MSYGYHNHVVAQLHNDGAVSGTGSAVAFVAPKFYLPFKAELVGFYCSATAKEATKTDTIHVRAGGTNVTTSGVAMASGTTSGSTTSILGNYKVHDAGTLFDATATGSTGLTTTNCGVVLWFRSRKA
jgi:hypothetical protein